MCDVGTNLNQIQNLLSVVHTYIYTPGWCCSGRLERYDYVYKFKSNLKSAQCGTYQVGVVAGDFDPTGSDGIAQSNVKHPMLVRFVSYGNQKTHRWLQNSKRHTQQNPHKSGRTCTHV